MSDISPKIFCFLPLASIGGTESVHADLLKTLQAFRPQVFIRYRGNVWKGKAFASSAVGRKQGRAMLPVYRKFARVSFCSDYLEAPRFGRVIRKFFIRKLAFNINRHTHPIVIFWHRESVEFIWPYLKSHVHIIDLVHNNSSNQSPDAKYLVNDWAPRINQRVVVSPFLRSMLLNLYNESGYQDGLADRIKTIPHTVSFPDELTKEFGLPLKVIFVGRDSVEKRFHLILEIAKKALKLRLPLRFKFVGPEPEDYKDFLGLENCHWCGLIEKKELINKIYEEAHIILLTSQSEGFPKVLAEAMAYGVVPLATSVGGVPDFISENETGFMIFETKEDQIVIDFVSKLKYLSDNTEHLINISERVVNFAKENFFETKFENSWMEVLNNA